MDPEILQGPCGVRNFTQDELLIQANRTHYNLESYRPSFLIRIHNLNFKRVAYGGIKSKSNFQSQDLTINIRRGEIYSVGQPDSFDKVKDEGQRIDEEDNTAINLFGDSYSQFVSDEHFAVGRDEKDDKVWIRDLNSKQGTFVNGAMLTPQINHELQDGDIVSLGISHLDPKCQLDKGIFWVFKYKDFPDEDESHLKTMYSQVLGNSVILSNILTKIYDTSKHLRDGQQRLALTQIRSVSKFWNEISVPILRKKLELNLKVNQEMVKFPSEYQEILKIRKESMNIWNEQFRANIAFFSSMGLQRLSFKESIVRYSTEITEAEVELFQIFFRSHGNQISKVVLGFPIRPESKKHKIRVKLLQNLFKECKNTTKYQILEDCSACLANVEASTSTTKLTIHSKIASYENLFRTFPNVVKISLGSNCIEEFFQFMSNSMLEKEALKHFKVLKLHPVTVTEILNIAFNFTNFPIKIEECILQNMTFDQIQSLIILLMRNEIADNLRKFKLGFDSPKGLQKDGIRFPKMEKLERLEVTLNNQITINWSFQLDGFPNLKVINVKSDRMEDTECDKHKFLESLISEENKQHFPKLEKAFISYGQLESKNFA